ncbi:hypothetical protein [Kalamiella sp. sgz302252]|uniref:hypothetical protein n=1 Tax=Pantoea sp. sgz302252 TaxID=3341827 RepID=UPI0036D34184
MVTPPISASATVTTLASARSADSCNYPGSIETLKQVGMVARTQGVIAKRDRESNQC